MFSWRPTESTLLGNPSAMLSARDLLNSAESKQPASEIHFPDFSLPFTINERKPGEGCHEAATQLNASKRHWPESPKSRAWHRTVFALGFRFWRYAVFSNGAVNEGILDKLELKGGACP